MEITLVLTTTTAQVPQVKGVPFKPPLLPTATPPSLPTSATLATTRTTLTGRAVPQTPPTPTSTQWGSLSLCPTRVVGFFTCRPPPGVEGPPQAAGTSSRSAETCRRPGFGIKFGAAPPAAPTPAPGHRTQNANRPTAPPPPTSPTPPTPTTHPTDKPAEDLPSLTLLAL